MNTEHFGARAGPAEDDGRHVAFRSGMCSVKRGHEHHRIGFVAHEKALRRVLQRIICGLPAGKAYPQRKAGLPRCSLAPRSGRRRCRRAEARRSARSAFNAVTSSHML